MGYVKIPRHCKRFISLQSYRSNYAPVAQSVEHFLGKKEDVSSTLTVGHQFMLAGSVDLVRGAILLLNGLDHRHPPANLYTLGYKYEHEAKLHNRTDYEQA